MLFPATDLGVSFKIEYLPALVRTGAALVQLRARSPRPTNAADP